MKRLRFLARLTFVLCFLALILTIGDFLALHDINHDYVSSQVLRSLDTLLIRELPAWTATRGEWAMVSVSFLFRLGFLALNAVTLALCMRALKHHATAPRERCSHSGRAESSGLG